MKTGTVLIWVILIIIFIIGVYFVYYVYFSEPGQCVIINPELNDFESFYILTLPEKFKQKAESIQNPNRQFTDDFNLFEGLRPFENASDFSTALHTLIGYGVRYIDPADELYMNTDLAFSLCNSLLLIANRLPIPAPVRDAPWGHPGDWYMFSIIMTECFQHLTIVLRNIYDLRLVTEAVLRHYLPSATYSLGWDRTSSNIVRMGLPYIYSQMLRNVPLSYIEIEDLVQYTFENVYHPQVKSGNGIHMDYVYFDHIVVRAYGYLINLYFTFSYYNKLFKKKIVNMHNVTNAFNLISCKQGLAHPAVLSRNGSHWSSVLGHFIDYKDGVYAADFSKILTIRNKLFFSSVVGNSNEIAYYEADLTNNCHAPLWAMTRKIWANDKPVIRYRSETLGLESGVIVYNTNGNYVVETTTTNTSVFFPNFAFTGIVSTTECGGMLSYGKFDEINIEFKSYTMYHPWGMIQLYDEIKAETPLTSNPKLVILPRDLTRDTNDRPFSAQTLNNVTFNGVTAKHINIRQYRNLANFGVTTSNQMEYVNQAISFAEVNNGTATCGFEMVHYTVDSYYGSTVTMVNDNPKTFMFSAGVAYCLFAYPFVILQDKNNKEISINDSTFLLSDEYTLNVSTVAQLLSYFDLALDNLRPLNCKRNADRFYHSNAHGSQFKFSVS